MRDFRARLERKTGFHFFAARSMRDFRARFARKTESHFFAARSMRENPSKTRAGGSSRRAAQARRKPGVSPRAKILYLNGEPRPNEASRTAFRKTGAK
jgi:hypothetical protein